MVVRALLVCYELLSGYSYAVFHCYAANRVIWVAARVLLMVAWALLQCTVVLLHVLLCGC